MDDSERMKSELPPLEELESIRQKLLHQLDEAPKLFACQENGKELRTLKAALDHVEMSLSHMRDGNLAETAVS